MKRVYICHTYFHTYITLLREFNIKDRGDDKATLILSTMSNDFGRLKDRIEKEDIFEAVYYYDEKEDVTSEDVMKYHRDRGNTVLNLLQRIKYTKELGKLQEKYIPVDLKQFDEVYVFCDSDPIGYYLNYKKIKYHALEDGLNSGKLNNMAMLSNMGAWKLKKAMAGMGLIFIENGYSKYCIDFIVNDISVNYKPPKNIVECPFDDMWNNLSADDHDKMARIYIEDIDELRSKLASQSANKPKVMILTEPLSALDVRKKIFGDLIEKYGRDYTVIIKPHPRDELDYEKEFPDTVVLRGRFPMEVINDVEDLQVEKLVSIITQVNGIKFAKEIDYLGKEFLIKYENPDVLIRMEKLTGTKIK